MDKHSFRIGDTLMPDYKKEIGGYMELEEFYGEEYHSDAIGLNSGRHCLEYLIKARNIKKIYLPYFLCASVREICEKCEIEYNFYHIDEEFNPIIPQVEDRAYVYIVNYYGQKAETDILKFKEKYKNIIVDNAQHFFATPVQGIDTLYTCRKFFGVVDGGYLYTDAILNESLDTDISYQRMEFVLGRYEMDATTFYKKASNNNKIFRNEDLKLMSKLTHNLLKGIDYKSVIKKRNQNFAFLHSQFKEINKLSLTLPEGAFMYPLYIENGMNIKKKLTSEKIYIPTLWPDVFESCEKDSLEYDFAENILPLPCDQRYNEAEMKKVAEVVIECIN